MGTIKDNRIMKLVNSSSFLTEYINLFNYFSYFYYAHQRFFILQPRELFAFWYFLGQLKEVKANFI